MSGIIGITPPKPAQTDASSSNNDDLVRDIDQQDFETAVIEASMSQPILVDFWADWCGPCKALGPLIEKVVNAAGGAVKLVKIDTDKNQELASQLRIQSLPTVYAFFEGRPIDGFQGALPESQIKEFVDKLIETTGATVPEQGQDLEAAIAKAQQLIDDSALDQAEELINDLMAVAGDKPETITLMAKLLLAQGKKDELGELLSGLEQATLDTPAFKAISAGLSLSNDAEGLPDLATLRANLASEPDSMDAKFDLAKVLLSQGKQEEAVDLLLGMFKQDRDWKDGAARLKLLELFDIFGQADPFTIATRRRFSALLYS